MKRPLSIATALLALAAVAPAHPAPPPLVDAQQPITVQQLPSDDDPELIRPGPRGEEGEPIEPRRPWTHPWADAEPDVPLPQYPPDAETDDRD